MMPPIVSFYNTFGSASRARLGDTSDPIEEWKEAEIDDDADAATALIESSEAPSDDRAGGRQRGIRLFGHGKGKKQHLDAIATQVRL